MRKPHHDTFNSLDVKFEDFYDLKEIGSGKDCVIYRAKCRVMPKAVTVVVKAYNKSTVSKVKVRSIKREARMMDLINKHRIPSVVGYHGSFQDSRCMYLVMEYCGGGDLLEKLLSEGRAMTEKRVVNEVAIPLLISLSMLHKIHLIHRDIKLENIFVDENDRVKFGDFGLTMSMNEERGISPVGTVEYMAPELCRLPPAEMIMSGRVHPDDVQAVDEKVDVWALGVTMYELVTGRSPFDGDNKMALKQNIIKMNMKRIPKFLTPECSDFIAKMMVYEAARRPPAEELLRHPWILMNAKRPPHSMSARTVDHDAHPSGMSRQHFGGHGRHRPHSAKPLHAAQSHKINRSSPQSRDSHVSGIKARHVSEGSPAPPLLSPDSILIVTAKRKEKFGAKLAALLPTYGAKKEREVCMRGLWNFEMSESESDSDGEDDDQGGRRAGGSDSTTAFANFQM